MVEVLGVAILTKKKLNKGLEMKRVSVFLCVF